jgi:hypothetical protein
MWGKRKGTELMAKAANEPKTRKMLRVRNGQIEAEEGQNVSDQQALALAIQYLGLCIDSAASQIRDAAEKIRR